MDILKKLTAAPRAFTYKGARYELSPLNLQELAMAKDFVKRYIMDEAKKSAAMMAEAGAPEAHLQELWREAAEAFKKPLDSNFMEDTVPMMEFMRLSLRHRHPDIQEALVLEMFSDVRVWAEIIESVQELNAVEEQVKNS